MKSWWWLATVLLAAGLALAVLGPNLPHFAQAAVGAGGSDAFKHVWSQWWVWHELTSTGRIPSETELIFFPNGGAFVSLDTATVLLTAPLRLLASPLVAYNLGYLLHIGLAAIAAAVLARRFVPDRPEAAWVAGPAFGASAWVLAFPLGSGVSETLFLFPLPLLVLSGWSLLSSPERRWILLTPALLLVQAFGCWSYAILGSVALAALFLVWLGTRPWTDGRLRPTLIRLGGAVGLLAVVVVPAYLATQGAHEGTEAVYERTVELFPSGPSPLSLPETNSAPLVDLFLPGDAGLRVARMGVDQLMYAASAGFLLLGLACFGAWRSRAARVALALAGLFLLLAMGPRIHLDHARTWPGLPNPVFLLFYYAFPLFNASIHSVDRFLNGVQLGLGVAAAIGLSRLPGPRWLAAVAALLVTGETLFVSAGPWPVAQSRAELHPVSLALAEEEGAVWDIPWYDADGVRFHGDIFLQQTAHGRPVPFRLEGLGDQVVSPDLRANRFYQAVVRGQGGCEGVAELRELGFGHVLLRPDRGVDPRASGLLERCLGQPEDHGDVLWWRL